MYKTLHIIPEEEFSRKIVQVEEELSTLRREGFFTAEDGAKMYYEYFLAQNPVGAVVFVHGLSEFTKKYYEFAYYFQKQGFHVFLYDQRGHGKSHRDTDRPELIHINSFDKLVEDLDTYIEKVVRPISTVPLYLYAHSMGGAVGILYLAKHGHKLKKAVLTSPLLMPRMNDYPAWPFLISTAIGQVLRGKKAKFLLSDEYEVNKPYTPLPGDSPSRVRHSLAYRDREPLYRSTPMTLGCVRQSLKLRRRLLNKKVTQAMNVPTLMLCADQDALVKVKYQQEFAKRCPNCLHQILPGANHALHTDRDEVVEKTLSKALSFLA